MRTFVYADGFNLYYGTLKGTPYKWSDTVALLERILQPQRSAAADRAEIEGRETGGKSRCAEQPRDRSRTEVDMLWINEGFVLDDAGNMLTTSYIDLRDEGERPVIRSVVKGCRREHALEDGETVLISKPERFREYGVALIRDEQEGFAKEELVTLEAETPEEAAKRRATADLNEAIQLVGSGMKPGRIVEYSRRKTQSESFSHGKDWWIFCASTRPDDADWDAWKATLDKDYDHVSEIGQPAKFAQALARMVTEQIGPKGKDAWLTGTSEGVAGARTKHRYQWVIQGPVVYTDRLYETIVGEEDEVRRMAACLFAKPITHAAQREYRFVVMNGGAAEETVLLKISGMMRDALKPTAGGLIRPSPAPAEMVGDDGAVLSRGLKASTTQQYKRATVTERKERREQTRLETRDSKGQVLSSDIKRRESTEERIGTKELETDDRKIQELRRAEDHQDAGFEQPVLDIEQEPEKPGDADDEDAVAKEVALDERDWNDEHGRAEFVIPVVHRGSGRTFKSFGEMLEDPTAPMSPFTATWEVSACSPQELVKSYGAVATLALKIARVAVEHRQEAASACWHALQCINNIYARLGDIVDNVWIERHRFVVIHIKDSEEFKATGRIVIGPSGGYAYCLKRSKSENVGYSEGNLGQLFFPLGNHVETFESFGWPGKPEGERLVDGAARD